jgi:hypothetical protein
MFYITTSIQEIMMQLIFPLYKSTYAQKFHNSLYDSGSGLFIQASEKHRVEDRKMRIPRERNLKARSLNGGKPARNVFS